MATPDDAKGKATATYNAAADFYDGQQFSGRVIEVRSSNSMPMRASMFVSPT